MIETALSASAGTGEFVAMHTLGSVGGAPLAAHFANHDAEPDVSIAGVMLLSTVSVLVAVFTMVTLALVMIGCWWLISHIPVPPIVAHLLAKLHSIRV